MDDIGQKAAGVLATPGITSVRYHKKLSTRRAYTARIAPFGYNEG